VRAELWILGAGLLCWAAALASALTGRPAAGLLPLGLYPLYGLSAALGWLVGNAHASRRRSAAGLAGARRIAYLVGPPGLLFLLWELAPPALQRAAVLAPIWAYGVYVIFFLVPVTLRRR
jgi:hypothetical protein